MPVMRKGILDSLSVIFIYPFYYSCLIYIALIIRKFVVEAQKSHSLLYFDLYPATLLNYLFQCALRNTCFFSLHIKSLSEYGNNLMFAFSVHMNFSFN